MKKICLLLLVSIGFYSCGTNSPENKTNSGNNDTISQAPGYLTDRDSANMVKQHTDSEKATYFIVIADTGKNYYTLHDKMFRLNKMLHLTIDTMGRYYNKKKDLIALPENDEDAMYAGSYFQRRFPSETLSLEYLSYYTKNAGEKTIALMTGIYETQKTADSLLNIIKEEEVKSFVIKSEIYPGDIH